MKSKRISIRETIKQHIINNKKEYIIVALIFIIGIFLGVLFVNNMKEDQQSNMNDYINNFINKIKSMDDIDNIAILKTSIKQNLLLMLEIWFLGTTVIRSTNSFWNCII